MKNFKNGMSRREFIKQFGLAAGLAIPFLRSEVAMGQTSSAPVRLLLVPLQHGWGLDHALAPFTGTETNFTIPAPLKALNAIKHQCVFVDGLRTTYWGNAHDVSYSDLFTCAVRYNEPSAPVLGGPFPLPRSPSIDWMIANAFSKDVLRLSNNYRSFGAQYHPLCFDDKISNLPFYTKARDAYMGVIDPMKQLSNQDPTAKFKNQSLLSFLGKDTNKLLSRLSGKEKTKMEEYLGALNSLGSKILNPNWVGGNIVLPELPGLTVPFSNQMDFYLDMIHIAFTLDTHRVAVLGMGQGVTDWNWTNSANEPQVGNTFGNDFHHEIAHYSSVLPSNSRLAYEGWVDWYVKKIVGLVQTLENTIDVDGKKVIDNTIIVLTGEVSNGQHETRDKLYIVIGGGGNKINRGRWISTPKIEPRKREGVFWGSRDVNGNLHTCTFNYGPPASRHHAADLWVTIARLAGLNIDTFGIDVYNYQPIVL